MSEFKKVKLKNGVGEYVYPEIDPDDKGGGGGTSVTANPTSMAGNKELYGIGIGDAVFNVLPIGVYKDSYQEVCNGLIVDYFDEYLYVLHDRDLEEPEGETLTNKIVNYIAGFFVYFSIRNIENGNKYAHTFRLFSNSKSVGEKAVECTFAFDDIDVDLVLDLSITSDEVGTHVAIDNFYITNENYELDNSCGWIELDRTSIDELTEEPQI